MNSKFIAQFKAARNAAAPLIAVRTPDPAATIQLVASTITDAPLVMWDIVRGFSGLNDAGKTTVANAVGADRDPSMMANPVEALSCAAMFTKKTITFALNMQRVITNDGVVQGIWNLRDLYKGDKRQLVMLGCSMQLPAELEQDALIFDEPLPTLDELKKIVLAQFEAAQLSTPDDATVSKAVDAICGLAAFNAEQVVAMSLTRDGLDLDALWERKRASIEQAKGLSVWRGGETFDDIGGCDNAKTFLKQILAGNEAPRAVVFIDEIEKALSGASGDTSGVSQEMLGTLLTYMQDKNATGVIFVGPPGAAKSAIAKATGNTAKIPTIAFDLSGMKGSLVGESGEALRNALKVCEAVAQGRTLFIATCNSIGVLPPELRRRFNFGTFFFDLPTAVERETIWNIYAKKYSLAKQDRPDDEGWTGAEIRMCCDIAYRLKCSLIDASTYIVPVARSAAEQITKLREQANGRFISASARGVYRYERTAMPPANVLRAISQGEA